MPIAGTSSPAVIAIRDAGNEPTDFRVYGIPLTAANWTAQQTLWSAVKVAGDALILGAVRYTEYGNKLTNITTQPTNGAAREIALLTQFQDTTTGQRFTASLGTLDPTIPHYVINNNAKDIVLLTEPDEIVAWVTALNAFCISPITGNALAVVGLKVARGKK